MTTSRFASIATLALIGAATVGPASAIMPVTPRSYARLGQTVTVGMARVTPLALLEDSRCPAQTLCVWAGQVRIRVRIAIGRSSQQRELTLHKPVRVGNGMLELAEVTPELTARGSAIPRQNYRFGFRFTPQPMPGPIHPVSF